MAMIINQNDNNTFIKNVESNDVTWIVHNTCLWKMTCWFFGGLNLLKTFCKKLKKSLNHRELKMV